MSRSAGTFYWNGSGAKAVYADDGNGNYAWWVNADDSAVPVDGDGLHPGMVSGDVLDIGTKCGGAAWNDTTSPSFTGTTITEGGAEAAVLSLGGSLTTDGACTFGGGVAIVDVNGHAQQLGGTWLGDISVGDSSGGYGSVALSFWKVNNGSPGGSVSLAAGAITVGAPAEGQSPHFHNFACDASTINTGVVDVHSLPNLSISGALGLLPGSTGFLFTPSGTWVTLTANGASALGVTLGHLPASGGVTYL
jgi:hypothetical protein